jgi:DNA (cytosine-5)-methyltransferase 1
MDENHNTCETVLEPAQVVDFNLDTGAVVLRRLQRRRYLDVKARPNELLITTEIFERPPNEIIRKCHVHCLREHIIAEGLPMPYSRNGAGDFFFVHGHEAQSSSKEMDTTATEERDPKPNVTYLPPLKSDLDFVDDTSVRKLRGMGIFCGGGNFDRGLADGGGVDFGFAIDYAKAAIYSYKANVEQSENVKCIHGSVDDYLAQAMAGSRRDIIARPGDVNIILAGSPCPGFSGLQRDKTSGQSLQNASKVASFVSFVDFYSPSYCMLENVVGMTYGLPGNRKENVFAQILAALVAMGYQVQQFYQSAWACGDPESRDRVFIVASAPELELLRHPPQTHSLPPHVKVREGALGKSSNGVAFGKRLDHYTPFQCISAAESTADLPDIGDSQPQLCPAFPDHRTSSDESATSRNRIAAVPVRKYTSLMQAGRKGKLQGEPLQYYKSKASKLKGNENSRSYSRLHPDGLFPTVTTKVSIGCRQTGRCLHWSQDRSMTVLEYRRPQGYPDDDVIIGTPSEQMKIVGNSVNRNNAFGLGLAVKESWENSREEVRARAGLGSGHDHTQIFEGASVHDEGLYENNRVQAQTPAEASSISGTPDDIDTSSVDVMHATSIAGGDSCSETESSDGELTSDALDFTIQSKGSRLRLPMRPRSSSVLDTNEGADDTIIAAGTSKAAVYRNLDMRQSRKVVRYDGYVLIER